MHDHREADVPTPARRPPVAAPANVVHGSAARDSDFSISRRHGLHLRRCFICAERDTIFWPRSELRVPVLG